MAYKTQEQVLAGYINNRKEAQAWLNLELVENNGERHRLPKGLGMYESQLEEFLIRIAKENPAKEFKFVGKIHIPSDKPATELELDL